MVWKLVALLIDLGDIGLATSIDSHFRLMQYTLLLLLNRQVGFSLSSLNLICPVRMRLVANAGLPLRLTWPFSLNHNIVELE